MAKKKTEEKEIRHAGDPNVMGLRGAVVEQPITATLDENYMPYAMSVIVSRAIPEIDGFKPSHRKLLYTMYKMGLLTGSRTKSANIVGQTMRLNPHGDQAIYETMVRLAKGNESLLHPFVDSKGNFGKVYSRDMAYAASRYTEAKLSPICAELFRDLDCDAVDFVDNYDNTTKEPSLLPTTYPNVLVSANQGIAVGMASQICGFNLGEVCETTIAYLKNPAHDIASTLLAPDFPTGGQILCDADELREIYRTGRGGVKIRSRYRYDKKENLIEVYEIPYSTSIEAVLDKVAELAKAGKVKEINDERKRKNGGHEFTGQSCDTGELKADRSFALDYITAVPRMALYMKYSTRIYDIYLKYVAPEDIHVYSIDEVFMDVTDYLHTYRLTPEELAGKIMREIYEQTGITATAGIGTNLYLAKIAMDIMAKHSEPDENGFRFASLDEMSYRRSLWNHRPLTDFWRVGRGYAKKLEQCGLYTMGDIARCSVGKENEFYNEELLYKMFGVNAELLIDHAWGWEPCTIADVKAYQPEHNSVGAGQVLHCPYDAQKAKIVVKEMLDLLTLDLVEKHLVTDQIVLTVGYDIENLTSGKGYTGEVTVDRYGRKIPKHAHGTANLREYTASARMITDAVMELYDRIVNPHLMVRRISMAANHVLDEKKAADKTEFRQLDLFTDFTGGNEKKQQDEKVEREKKMQETVLSIKKKYGKNAILKGLNFQEGATTKARNEQIGGHKA